MIRSARAVLTVLTVSAAFGQLQDNRDKQLNCENRGAAGQPNFGFDNARSHKCEVHEQTLASVGQLTIDPGRNGGVSVKGWTRNDVLVRARIEAWADSDSAASLLFSQVHSDATAGRIAASGPDPSGDSSNRSNWSVSYEIFAPQSHNLTVMAKNGGISISDISGRMDLDTKNGAVSLKRVVGDITGKTKNGPVQLEAAGTNWQGRQLDLETKNGPIKISVPANFQGHGQADTVNGPVRSDLGGVVADSGSRRPPHKLDLNLGAGGATLKASTKNGPISLARL